MQNRTIIFLVLSLLILIAYQPLLKLMGIDVAPAPAPQTQEAVETKPATNTPAPKASVATVPSLSNHQPTAAAPQLIPSKDQQEDRVVVETDLYRAVFSTRGAVVNEWTLKKYLNEGLETQVNLFEPPSGPVQHPLALEIDGASGLENAIYQVNRNHLTLSGDQSDSINFTFTDPDSGAKIVKTLTFRGDDYAVDVALDTTSVDADYTLSLGSNFGIHTWGVVTIGFVGAANLVDGDVEREDIDDLDQPLVRSGDVGWAVTEDKYFIAGLLPKSAVKSVRSQAFGDEHVVTALTMAGGSPSEFTLYVGPKEYDRLKALGSHMAENIDFGWFMFGTWSFVRLLAEPMFVLLQTINGFSGNYGVSIILLTLLIKTVFIPLTHKSYKSMRAMAAIQPQVKAIQKKYKDNKEKLSRETMALYREHSINPLGGCLPIFLQIPFFIAFFNILYTAIELRQTPFAGWIVDLSLKDPMYVLPVIMGVSMFVQQKIQPTAMDPKQARIMMFLPVIFTFFFMNFPAGLVLYWLFNNLFTITQQFVTTRFLQKPAKA